MKQLNDKSRKIRNDAGHVEKYSSLRSAVQYSRTVQFLAEGKLLGKHVSRVQARVMRAGNAALTVSFLRRHRNIALYRPIYFSPFS